MKCTRCSELIEPGATFCGNCGQPVVQAAPAPMPAPAPAAAVPAPVPVAPAPSAAAPVGQPPVAVAPQAPTTWAQAAPAPAMNPTGPMPSYAVADPAHQKSETKSMVGLVLSVLSMPGALIPILGLVLGIVGLVIGTTTRATAKKTISMLTIIFSVIGILGAIGSYIYFLHQDQQKKTSSLSSQQDSSSTSGSGQSSGSATASSRSIDTPCYKVDVPKLTTLDNASGSCNLKSYNTASSSTATNIYTVDTLAQSGVTADKFVAVAKSSLSDQLKATLPGFVVSSEKTTTFADSPAYVINGKYQSNIGVEMMFVYHPVAHGENIYVIVHAIQDGTGDTSTLSKNWTWK